jgi:hypothetical protein
MSAVTELLDRVPVLQSVSADLKRGTWTFATPARQPVSAGEYALVPVKDLRAAEAADAARVSVSLQASDAPRDVYFSDFNGYRSYHVTTEDDSYEASMQTERLPENARQRGVWYGSESLLDSLGRRWSRSLAYMLIDDFGNLVEVPE